MRHILIITALLVICLGLRSCHSRILKKLGAFTFLITAALSGYWIAGFIGMFVSVALIFIIPVFTLCVSFKGKEFPVFERLPDEVFPDEAFFPNASKSIQDIEDSYFEHVEDVGWKWLGMQQFHKVYWNPEEQCIATVVLCEKDNVAFAYMSTKTLFSDGQIVRTTNYPFSKVLLEKQNVHWHHIPCEEKLFSKLLTEHQKIVTKLKGERKILIPDPDELIIQMEKEMISRIQFNKSKGIITLSEPTETYQYSTVGLFYLWKQSIKNMIRLC